MMEVTAKITEAQLSGMGRQQVEALVLGLQVQLEKLQREALEVVRVIDAKESTVRFHKRQVDELQTRGTELITQVREAERSVKGLQLMLDVHPWCWLLVALDGARKKHPQGPTFWSLADEVGEAARVWTKEGGNGDRYRAELADVAVVAIRLFLGEEDKSAGPSKPHG